MRLHFGGLSSLAAIWTGLGAIRFLFRRSNDVRVVRVSLQRVTGGLVLITGRLVVWVGFSGWGIGLVAFRLKPVV